MKNLTPKKIVRELDKYIVGQASAKRSVAIALRNRWRRQQVEKPLRDEISPNNIILIGSTGVGKTEISRRLALLVSAPFIKIEASKFTEVGYVGRDVESMIRDLIEVAVKQVKNEKESEVTERALQNANERILEILFPISSNKPTLDGEIDRQERTRNKLKSRLEAGDFEDKIIKIKAKSKSMPMLQVMGPLGMDDMSSNIQDMLSSVIPSKKKTQRVKVSEAREIFSQQEADKLIDMDEVVKEAVYRAEQTGFIFLVDPK